MRVIPRPTLAILPTGDELVEPAQVPGPGQIRNSNAVMLEALAIDHSAFPRVFPIAPDEPGELHRIVQECLVFDVLLVTGGVSAGQRDLVPAALERSGVRRVFHKVRMKPGKPLWFGIGPPRGEQPGTLVFGLPGNPASTLVGFLVFVAPALQVLAGRSGPVPAELSAAARLRVPPSRRPSRPTGRRGGWNRRPGPGQAAPVSSKSWIGQDRPTCWAWPGPTASSSSVLATEFSRQEKLSVSCRYANIEAAAPSSNERNPFFRGAGDDFQPGDGGGDPDRAP